jgi:ribosomal protein S18 acetylase RimI-like enzyme
MEIRLLLAADAHACRQLRLEGLRDSPNAFASHYDDEVGIAVETVAQRLEPDADSVILGAFDNGSLIGMVGIRREARKNVRHKAVLWGMYVTPTFRGRGIGRKLLERILERAVNMSGLRQVNLCVNTENASAIAMYRAAGFETFGVERAFLIVNGAPQDLIHMVRAL